MTHEIPFKNWRINEFCAVFGIGRTKFYDLVKKGEIRTVKLGSTTLIPSSEAIAYQERLEGMLSGESQ